MQHGCRFITLVLIPMGLATPCIAGMDTDLSACKAADRLASAEACTRVLESGRLPHSQFYIAHFNRGWAYRNAGEYDKALTDFDRAAKLNPRYADTYYSRAVVQHDRGEKAKSIIDLDRYVEVNGNNWTAYYKRALMFRRLSEADRALADLQKAAALNPTELKIPLLRALLLSDKDEHAEGQAEIDKVLAAKPETAGGYYARALIAFRQRRLDSASADVEKALALQDAYPAAHTLLGRILEERGDTVAAAARYQRSLASSAKSIDAQSAQIEARERLQKLTTPAPAHVASSSVMGCRRYIPAVGATISIDCDE